MLIAHLAHLILGLCRTGVGTSAAVNESTQPNAYGDPGSSNDDDSPDVIACGFLSYFLVHPKTHL